MKKYKYTFKGKIPQEWEEELENCKGLDENGNPKWWTIQANLEDSITFNELCDRINKTLDNYDT